MSASKSKGISSIFSAYSFCFPQELKSIIKDNNEENSLQESSLQLFIPINTVSIEFTSAKQNLSPQPGTDALTSKISSSTITKVAVQAPIQPATQPDPSPQQPQIGPTSGGIQQPTGSTSGGIQIPGQTPPPTGTVGATSQQKPGTTTGTPTGSTGMLLFLFFLLKKLNLIKKQKIYFLKSISNYYFIYHDKCY
jgi:hypothetical protein